MAKFTIKPEEIKRIQNVDIEDDTIEFDDIELVEVDENGDNYGLSFKADQSAEFEYERGDWWTPSSRDLKEHDVFINEIKVIDASCNEIQLTDEDYKDLEETIIDLIKNS